MTEELPDERPQRRREYSGASSTLGVAALIVIVVGAAIWFFEFRDAGSSGGGGTPGLGIVALAPQLNPTGKAAAAKEGRAAPDFRLRSVDGVDLQLSDLRGDYVLLNFWATWCGPCRDETPDLQALFQTARRETGQGGLIVVGVNQQEEPDTVRTFTTEFGVTYPVVLDRAGEVSDAYRVGRGLPMTFLIDPAGVIERIYYGRITSDALAAIASRAGAAVNP